MNTPKRLPLVPIDPGETERLECRSLAFSGITCVEGLKPFIRLQLVTPDGWAVWTDVSFTDEEAASQMLCGLLSLKMYSDGINKAVDK